MRALVPDIGDAPVEQIATWYAYEPGVTLRSNMIMTADGVAIGPDGLAGSISGPEDLNLLATLRVLSDAVVVGAGTLRAEHYQPVKTRPSMAGLREKLGLAPHPTLVMVTREPKIDDSFRALAEAPVRPIVVCARDNGLLSEVATTVECPAEDGGVDLEAAVEYLAERGLSRMLTEGGPHLLGDLLAANVLDEYCLTVAPRIYSGGPTLRPVMGTYQPTDFILQHTAIADGFLFLRYRKSPAQEQA